MFRMGGKLDKIEQIMNGTPVYEDGKKIILLTPNMTLRDYIATQVYPELAIYALGKAPCAEDWRNALVRIAKDAYLAADALLAERETREEK